jgi:hypothetical protein
VLRAVLHEATCCCPVAHCWLVPGATLCTCTAPQVVHTCGNLLRVNVTATKHCQLMDAPGAMAADVTNEFHFVLGADAPA